MRTHKRRWSVIGALAMVLSTLAIGVATAPSASADTTESNACVSVTAGSYSVFNVPITGTATTHLTASPFTVHAAPAVVGTDSITLSGVSVQIQVPAALIGAGISTGVVSAAPDLDHVGVERIDTPPAVPTIPDTNGGVSHVVAAVGSVTLSVTATNADDGTAAHNTTQVVSNTAPATTDFFVTADAGTGANVKVYTSVSPPPNGTVQSRTGTLLVGDLSVTIPLQNSEWVPTGVGTASFKESNIAPPSTTPLISDGGAPLSISPKINPPPFGPPPGISVPFHCWPGTTNPAPPTSGTSIVPVGAAGTSAISTIATTAPPTAPVCASPQAASVGGGQSVQVVPSCSDINSNFTASNTSIALIGANGGATHGTVTVQANGNLLYANDGLGATTDSFQYNATDTTPLTSNTVTVNVAVLNNQCTATPSCNLRQVLILPVVPSTLSMSDVAAYGNPTFSQAVLGGHLVGTTCTPGFVQLNGQPQTACGALNPITVINARGTDARWDITAQVTDFIDGTRGPGDVCTGAPGGPNNVSPLASPNNIAQATPDNHCIPGDNLGWVPMAQITHPAVPGDTAAIGAGGIILPPSLGGASPQVPPAFPPGIATTRFNVNTVTSPFSILNLTTPGPGLHDLAQELCGAPANQSGGTFQCDAGLLLAVPASAAAGQYTATLTLTLT